MENNRKTDFKYNVNDSYVAKDKIWKAYVEKIELTAKNWSENWGFYIDNKVLVSVENLIFFLKTLKLKKNLV